MALRVLFACCALMSVASIAAAAGANLYWNDCSLGPTAAKEHRFACDSNDGFHVLVGSFDPPYELTTVNGFNAIVELWSPGSCPLASWWEFKNPGTCRQFALSANFIQLPGQEACADFQQAQAFGGVTAYLSGVGGDYRRARVGIHAQLPIGLEASVLPGTEYYAFNLMIRNSNTVGQGACAGCAYPLCIIFAEIQIAQPAGAPGGSPTLTTDIFSYAFWQREPLGGCTCLHDSCLRDPCTTLTTNRTWGQIKGLYR